MLFMPSFVNLGFDRFWSVAELITAMNCQSFSTKEHLFAKKKN